MNQEQIEELDRILKLWADSFQKGQSDSLPLGCQHEPKYYIGFREEYEFCQKCDAKKINGLWIDKTQAI
jgi:hypothetical protein